MSKRSLRRPSAASTTKTPTLSTASQTAATTGAAPVRACPPQQDTAAASSPHKHPVESGSQPQPQAPQQEADPAAMQSLLKAINNLTYTVAKRTAGANNDPLVTSPAAGPRAKGRQKDEAQVLWTLLLLVTLGTSSHTREKAVRAKQKAKERASLVHPRAFRCNSDMM